MIFRKKINPNDSKLDVNFTHKLAGLESISSIFKKQSGEINADPIDDASLIEKYLDVTEHDLPNPSPSKSVKLIQEVQKLEDRAIKPFVDYNEGKLFYPILSKVGEVQDNMAYLDALVSDGILEKKSMRN